MPSGTRHAARPIWVSILLSAWASVFLGATLSIPFLLPAWSFAQTMTASLFTVTVAFGLLLAAGILSPAGFKAIVSALRLAAGTAPAPPRRRPGGAAQGRQS